MYLTGIGLVSQKTARLSSNSSKCRARPSDRAPEATASHSRAIFLGARLPTAFISPVAPTASIGKLSSSSPTKTRNSGPKRCRSWLVCPRSLTACLIPTSVGSRAAIHSIVSASSETAARPGMW